MARGLALILLAWMPRPASANDTAVGPTATGLAAVAETRVQMVREEIVLTGAHGVWEVEADYWFRNPTTDSVDLQVGFPERARCECVDCDWVDPSFRELRTWVDDVEVDLSVDLIDVTPAPSSDQDCRTRAHLFDLYVGANAIVHVEHRYELSSTELGGWGESVAYVTSTGANWSGAIEDARFTLRRRLADPPLDTDGAPMASRYTSEIQFAGNIEAVSRREYFDAGERYVEVVFEATDWTPAGDIQVWFLDLPGGAWGFSDYERSPLPRVACPRLPGSDDPSRDAALRGMTDDELRVARNAPYAAHGYSFASEDLRNIFYGPGWNPGGHPGRGARMVVPYMPNPDYSDGLLYPGELDCIAAVRREEERRRQLD